MSNAHRPDPDEYFPYFSTYIDQVHGEDLISVLESTGAESTAQFRSFSEEQGDHRYAPEKWSVKELIQHMIDTERIMSYRALTFARMDPTPLPGFEENDYASNSKADHRKLSDLITEFDMVRQCTIALYNSFDEEMMKARGVANGKEVTVRALGWIIAGHCKHHAQVLVDRYR